MTDASVVLGWQSSLRETLAGISINVGRVWTGSEVVTMTKSGIHDQGGAARTY
jgi:hypothetical protein